MGRTPVEIAEIIKLPETLSNEFYNRRLLWNS